MLPCLECTRGRCSSLPDKHSNAAAAAAVVEREQLEQTQTVSTENSLQPI